MKTIYRNLIALVLIILTLSLSKLLNTPLQYVKIFSTYTYLNKKQLQKIIKPAITPGFFRFNSYELRNLLLQNPWIEAVSIRRIWPNSIIINILEQKPILHWDEKLINEQGEIFSPPLPMPELRLPEVSIEPSQLNDLLEIYRTFISLKWPFKLLKIENFANHYWKIEMDPTCSIILKNQQPAKHLTDLYSLLRKITQNFTKVPLYIDARYNGDLAIKWSK